MFTVNVDLAPTARRFVQDSSLSHCGWLSSNNDRILGKLRWAKLQFIPVLPVSRGSKGRLRSKKWQHRMLRHRRCETARLITNLCQRWYAFLKVLKSFFFCKSLNERAPVIYFEKEKEKRRKKVKSLKGRFFPCRRPPHWTMLLFIDCDEKSKRKYGLIIIKIVSKHFLTRIIIVHFSDILQS